MIQNNFSDGYKKALINSEARIKNINFSELNQEDVFLEVVMHSTGGIKELFDLYGVNEKLIIELVGKGHFNKKPDERKGKYKGLNIKMKDIILASVKIAAEFGKEKASLEDYLLAMLTIGDWLPSLLDFIGITPSDLEVNILELQKKGSIDGNINGEIEVKPDQIIGALTENLLSTINGLIVENPFSQNKKQENKKEDKSKTPTLDFFSTDLTKEANEGKIDNILGRDNEIERLIAILNRKTKNNPILLGEPGVGKTAIVEGLAKKIAAGEVPFSMKDKKILSLDINGMVAGTKYRGEFEQRIKAVVDEASETDNDVILFIDEIHTIIGAGGAEGTLDASNILKPAMGRGKIKIIGATTLNEYQKYIEKDSALERRFQKINAEEPSSEIATEIIIGLKESFEEYHNLIISEEACEEAVKLSKRYITDRYLPDKAIDLIDEACSLKSMQYNFNEDEINDAKKEISELNKKIEQAVIKQNYDNASELKDKKIKLEENVIKIKKKFSIPKSKRSHIKIEDIQKVLSIATGIPTENLSSKEIEKLKKLSPLLKKQIIGQNEAIESITRSIMRSRAGIGDSNRPLGSFLFLGPTGVGKTELIKVLAKEFYSDESALIKIDMSEYNDKTSVNKLIGSSAGYVGYEEGGMLTEKVRKKPYSIVLFDEIEKADFDVYNLLLQVLEDGVLTDNKGRKINFKNTILVMTSNIGADEFNEKAEKIGFNIEENEEKEIKKDYEKAKENIKNSLTDYFSPEFVNRIDKVVVFNPLDKKDIKKIVELRFKNLEKRLEEKNIKITYNVKVINFITKEVYNPEFGAREIRRYITDNIEDNIAENMVNKKVKDKVDLSIEKDKLKFEY
ncbi:MAG: ATP-dependent Clp protease ATP-binding subunit [Candidatus Gracilibacteria bacterium]|nr:ATP-dependent Clp protease ATP-binding subunit [Candidatus Gracilibacteria bacterium]